MGSHTVSKFRRVQSLHLKDHSIIGAAKCKTASIPSASIAELVFGPGILLSMYKAIPVLCQITVMIQIMMTLDIRFCGIVRRITGPAIVGGALKLIDPLGEQQHIRHNQIS